jgi:hypothetical protein
MFRLHDSCHTTLIHDFIPARSLGRGGSATSHLKRYDIDRVYHKSMAGGHPRESLEASFDVVHEGTSRGELLEAETIMVASQVMEILPARHLSQFGRTVVKSPFWYIRLNHTRLADAVLDLCGIPQKDVLRRACLRILSRFTSTPPSALGQSMKARSKRKAKTTRASQIESLGLVLEEAVRNHGMPKASAEMLRQFILSCLPVRPDVSASIDAMKKAIATLRNQEKSRAEPRRTKRFEDAARSLKSLKELTKALDALKLGPIVGPDGQIENGTTRCRPLYISLDLGLSQRRKHYHGGTIFQCIVLPDDFFDNPTSSDLEDNHDALISSSGRGTKVAEGGNYSELVRKNRPPGNFATALVNQYTSAGIPHCAGVRFSIGKFVELIYLDATLSGRRDSVNWNASDVDIDALRRSLGHPFSYSKSVQCVVASVHGMDAESTPERFLVAARLWSEGVSAEYLPQSNVMLSLVKRISSESSDASSTSDWSLLELNGVCALLKVPFIVIVQSHLLKDKGSVRLRQVDYVSPQGSVFSASSSGNNEIFVSLDDLATTILGATTSSDAIEEASPSVTGVSTSTREQRPSRPAGRASVECIYIDNDHYFGNDREVLKSETPQWKSYIKAMKIIENSAESYLSSLQDASSLAAMGMQCIPVFAVSDVSFWILRDFGTSLMRREQTEQSAAGACNEMIEKYGSKHKRSLKTLGVAVSNYMKRFGIWSHGGGQAAQGRVAPQESSSAGSTLMTALLYSKLDDRFDVITLNCCKNGRNTSSNISRKR